MPKISCIIPAFNCAPWLERAVNSVLATNYESVEVMVIDDGSTDGTLQIAKQLSARNEGKVRTLHHPGARNHGVSRTRNLGIERCTGEWICFLDADDYVYPHRFDSAAEILLRQPAVDGVHQLAEMVFPTAQSRAIWTDPASHFGFRAPIEASELLSHLLTGYCWATSAIVFRKELIERTGVFNESLSIAEDCNLWFRMASVGNLVSGDLSRPVSAYWRRLDSAYRPSPSQRLPMVRAMCSFLTWARHERLDPKLVLSARAAVSQYIAQSVTRARFAKNRKLAWTLTLEGVRQIPELLLNRAFAGQVIRLAAGR